ncbi:hypothetical protein, partial [Streptomyces sp. WAC00276]|uniref:hypothetical protein n=1 Tax=Streptomyces sp. WAC00276 TaxID=2933778 RepID=UPI0038D17CC0
MGLGVGQETDRAPRPGTRGVRPAAGPARRAVPGDGGAARPRAVPAARTHRRGGRARP